MNLKKLTRIEKENLYIIKMTELQNRWGYPSDSDWDFSNWTEDQLNEDLTDVIGQLSFEKFYVVISSLVAIVVVFLLFHFLK